MDGPLPPPESGKSKALSERSLFSTGRLEYLDGLRGCGAVTVLLYHVFCDGMPVSAKSAEILVKLVPFNGQIAVSLFFILSGFALSLGFLTTGNTTTLLKMAAGRYFRLVIPVFAICAVVFALLKFGLILPASERPPPFNQLLLFDPDLGHLVKFGLWDVFFAYSSENTYAGPLWTMSIEFIGSFLILGLLFVGGRRKMRWGLYAAALLIFGWMNSHYVQFVLGLVLAELWARRLFVSARPRWSALALAIALALPLLAVHDQRAINLCATLLFISVLLSPLAQGALSGRVGRHLGTISFPLYLVHGPIMFLVGVPLLISARGDTLMVFMAWLAVIAASSAASIVFVPVNVLAIRASHKAGRTAEALYRKAGEHLAKFSPGRVGDSSS
jgi:peptidoglycan/LPS O-acetylase OafA/YrhL